MMECDLIADLLPLYADGVASPRAKAQIDAHLAGCPQCSQRLAQLKAPAKVGLPPADGAPAEEARFLHKLRRRTGVAIALVLALLIGVPTALEVTRNDRLRRQIEAERQEQIDRAAKLAALSPDVRSLLDRWSVSVDASASRSGEQVLVRYAVRWPQDRIELVLPGEPLGRRFQVRDLVTWADYSFSSSTGQGSWGQGRADGELAYAVPAAPERVLFQYPALLAYRNAETDVSWDVRRPAEGASEVSIGQHITVQGIDFLVERVEFGEKTVRVHYRQLTDPSREGVHYLVFRFLDEERRAWNSMPLDELPDPIGPSHGVGHDGRSQSWRISVSHVALAIPRTQFVIDVR